MQKLSRLVTEEVRQRRDEREAPKLALSFISIARKCCTARAPSANRSSGSLARIAAGAEFEFCIGKSRAMDRHVAICEIA